MLIVDDDPAFRAVVASLLEESGLAVVGEAGSVADAVSTAMRLRPTAALVDVGLPDGDGFALARALTALPWRPRVVLTSTATGVGSARDVRGSGAEAFVHKGDLSKAPLAALFGAA